MRIASRGTGRFAFRLRLAAVALLALILGPATAVYATEIGTVDRKIELLVDGTVHQALFAIDFEGANGLAVGAEGELQQTRDGGQTWEQGRLPTDSAMLSVHMDSARTLVVGQAGVGFRREAGSSDFEKMEIGTDSRLFAVHANAGGLTAAVGEFGTLLVSQDSGKNWTRITPDWSAIGTLGGAEPHLYGVHVSDSGQLLAVGEFGLVIKSNDRGGSWTTMHKADASLFDIEILESGLGYAVGQGGYALRTEDAGQTWSVMETNSKSILIGIDADDSGEITLTAMRELLVSRDGGDTWKAVDDPLVTTVWYVGVASSGSNLLAVGQNGRIIRIGS